MNRAFERMSTRLRRAAAYSLRVSTMAVNHDPAQLSVEPAPDAAGEALAEGVPVAMRTFGGRGTAKKARCDTHLALPLGPLDRAAAVRLTGKLKAKRQTATPIAAALAKVADDLAAIEGSRTVVLVTDGNETCGGDVDSASMAPVTTTPSPLERSAPRPRGSSPASIAWRYSPTRQWSSMTWCSTAERP